MTPAVPTESTASLPLAGRAAVVTGGTRGIGAAITAALIRAGANVAVLARESAGFAQLERDNVHAHGELACCEGDVRDAVALEALVETARTNFGRLDIVVSNAGGALAPSNDPGVPPSRHLAETMQLNTGAALDLLDAAKGTLSQSPVGSVVVISSIAGRSASVTDPAYAASKAALSHLVRVWAHDLAPVTRVNGLLPGPVLTGAFQSFAERKPDAAAALTAAIPLGRLGRPEDIGAAALFFASDASSWVTGQLLEVDGGSVSAA